MFTSADDARLRQLKEAKLHMLRYEGLRTYQASPKQHLWHSNQMPIRALVGSNKSGKSFAGTVEMLNIIGGVHQYRPNYTIGQVNGRDCCVDFDVLNQVLLPIYQQMAPRTECKLDGLTYEGNPRIWPGLKGESWETAYSKTDRILYLANDSKIEFKSYSEEPDSFAGPVCHAIRMDEEPPEFVFNENMARQMTTKVNIMFTLTPLNYSQWLYHAIVDGHIAGKCFMVKMTYRDNPYINPEVVQMMEQTITDPAERAARLEGEFTYVTGRVWKKYGEHNFVPQRRLPYEWPCCIAIDPHEEKPTAVQWTAEDYEGRIWVYNELLLADSVEQVCKQIRAMSREDNIQAILMDESAKKKSTLRGKGSIVDEFRKYLPEIILCSNQNKDVGRNMVSEMAADRVGRGPRLFVMQNCVNSDHQFKNYSYKPPTRSGEDRKKAAIYKKNEDLCDDLVYRVMFGSLTTGVQFAGFGVNMYANNNSSYQQQKQLDGFGIRMLS